jgi:subtilisin family serine protease
MKWGLLSAAVVACAVLSSASAGPFAPDQGAQVEVVVGLPQPSLAAESLHYRSMDMRTTRRLNLDAASSRNYLQRLEAAQALVQQRVVDAIPDAHVRWRYRVVTNGFAVVVPEREVPRLASIPGVARVYPNVRYHPLLDQSVPLIGAPQLWGPTLATAGNGIKIGIIDDGIQQSHPFFSPRGFTMPPGFPKGQTAYTTAKVIVARAFAPPSPRYRYASAPFDPNLSEHATHVAGIAAGDHNTDAGFGLKLSGVAPRAYLGNYKALTIPTPGVGLNGNAAELAAAVEAAVKDGMDVINLSLGEPEIEPSRDVLVQAINGAAEAGVVPAIAAANDFNEFGFGSVDSPGSADRAITAAAATKGFDIADFSSGGPTPISDLLKPDVTAPGVSIYSSIPTHDGSWDVFNGTSMAAPHVAGGAALLRERHPTWTVEQIKSALVLTGRRVDGGDGREALTTREGGGMIYLPAADDPKLFAAPTNVSFGLARRGRSYRTDLALTDAGGGAGAWNVTVTRQTGEVSPAAPASVSVPGTLPVSLHVPAAAAERETTGFVVLTRGSVTRRIPYWFRVTAPALAGERHRTLRKPGIYRGNTRAGVARVKTYRYPESGPDVAQTLAGPEQVFRVRLSRPVANFGVVVLSRARGVGVQPRVVVAGNENRLTGYAGLPVDLNPYRGAFDRLVPVAGAIRPARGAYDIVFDESSRRRAGAFTFRFWVNDVRAPAIRLLTRVVRAAGPLRVRITDSGSGVDPSSISVVVDGAVVPFRYRRGVVGVPLGGLRAGRHAVVVRAADWEESKNMENVPPILPNTRTVRATFRVR